MVHFISMFCFFKQKTAYEMRISDWSSDVCSSDLVPAALTDYIAGRTGYDYNTHGKAHNDHVDFVPDEIVERFCILGTPEEHIAKLEQLRAIGEIGRASCRERGCQYV